METFLSTPTDQVEALAISGSYTRPDVSDVFYGVDPSVGSDGEWRRKEKRNIGGESDET